MATVSELVQEGRDLLDELGLSSFDRERFRQNYRAIERAVAAGRGKASEALTVLRDPSLAATRLAHANVAAADLLTEALALLDGTQEPEAGS